MNTDTSSLLLLLNWMSPTFPIGAFAYSHGLEQAIADGRVTTAADVESWIGDLLRSGSGWNDAVLFSNCWRSDTAELNELAIALAGSRERYLEITQLGRNFAIAASVWAGQPAEFEVIAYPIAAGSACRALGIPAQSALLAFLQGFAAALVSVAVRLVPLGQTKGLEILRDLAPVMIDVASRAELATLDELGSSSLAAEIAAMTHETLQPRIFRT
jgi:urease accessory protein